MNCKTAFPQILAVHSTPKRYSTYSLYRPTHTYIYIYPLNIYIYVNLYIRHEAISDKFFVPAKVTVAAIHSQDFGASRASQDQKARTQGPQAQHISSSFQLFKLRKGWRKWLEMTHSNIEMLVYKQRLCTSCFYFHVHIYMGKCWLIMHVCLHVFNKLL